MYYVYVYLDPRKEEYTLEDGTRLEHEPFYIGKGKGKRAWCHLEAGNRTNNSLKKGKIKRIINGGFVPKIVFLAAELSETEAMALEQEWITRIGTKWTIAGIKRGPLCNMTSGGDGYTMCDELREVYRVRNSGAGNPMYGKTHSVEARLKIGERSRSLRHTDDTKARMAAKRGGSNNPRALQWKVQRPDGSVVIVDDLKLFVRQYGLNYNSLYNSMANKKPVTRGNAAGYWLIGPA